MISLFIHKHALYRKRNHLTARPGRCAWTASWLTAFLEKKKVEMKRKQKECRIFAFIPYFYFERSCDPLLVVMLRLLKLFETKDTVQ